MSILSKTTTGIDPKNINARLKVTRAKNIHLHTSKVWCQKRDILNMFYNDGWKLSRLAKKFKVSKSTMSRIIHFNLI